jgi:hypothetical protein
MVLCQPPETLNYRVMTGHPAGYPSPHMFIAMTRSATGRDGLVAASQPFGRLFYVVMDANR